MNEWSSEKGIALLKAVSKVYYCLCLPVYGDLMHMVPKALIGLAVVTVKTDGWVFTFRL